MARLEGLIGPASAGVAGREAHRVLLPIACTTRSLSQDVRNFHERFARYRLSSGLTISPNHMRPTLCSDTEILLEAHALPRMPDAAL
jgi:hypothetical protein